MSPTPSSATSRDRKIAGAQLAIGLAFLVSLVFFSIRARFPIPYRDDWDWLGWLLTRPLTLPALFEPHNEHMIPLPRLLVELQYQLEGSGTHLVFVVAMTCQLALAWMFVREILRRWPEDRLTRWFAIGTTAVCLFFSHQLQSLVFMAAVLFPLVQTFAVVALVCALNAMETGANRGGWFAAAGAAAACAGLTTTNGFVVPLILALLVWTRRGSRTGMLVAGAVGIAGLAAYVLLVGRPWLHAPAPAGAAWTLPTVGEMAAFFLTFFASALAYGSISAAIALGFAMFGLGCYALWHVARRRDTAPRIEAFAVGVMLFATASAVMASPARAQFGALQAAQSRYASYSMAYTAALLLWSLSRLDSSGMWQRQRTRLMCSSVVVSSAALVAHVFIGAVWIAKADNIAVVKHALLAGVHDDEWIATLHPITTIVYETAERLKTAGDPLVTDPRIDTPLNGPASLDACGGNIALESLGARVGWRSTGALASRAASGVIVDRSGVIRGLAAPAPLVEAANPTSWQPVVEVVWNSIGKPARAAHSWLGFVKRGDGPPYTFYGLAADGSPVCRLATATLPERIRVYLDGPLGEVSGSAPGGGWAFQCEGSVERLRVFVDDVEQPSVSVERGVPRPDVRAAFAPQCDVGDGPGFSFQLNSRELSRGTHRVKVAADDPVGRTVESNTTEIVVR